MSSIPALSNVDLSNQVSVAVARKTLDAQQQQGQAVVDLLKAAAANERSEVAGSKGDSGGVDVYA